MFRRATAYLGWVFYVIALAGWAIAGSNTYAETGDWRLALHVAAVTGVTLAGVLLMVHAVWRLQVKDGDDDRPNLRGTRFEHVNKRTLAWQLDEAWGGLAFGRQRAMGLATYAGVAFAGLAAAGFARVGLTYDPEAVGMFARPWAAAAVSAAAFLVAGIGLLVRRSRRR